MLERATPDVIVLDLRLPRINGLDFLRALDRKGLRTPVVVCSALVPEDGGFAVPGVKAAPKARRSPARSAPPWTMTLALGRPRARRRAPARGPSLHRSLAPARLPSAEAVSRPAAHSVCTALLSASSHPRRNVPDFLPSP